MSSERPLVVLIVEDDSAIRELSAMILEDAGHEVHAVRDGDAADAWLQQNEADLLFTDIRMPGRITGEELARRHAHMRVLVTSGEVKEQHPWLDERMVYLPKPYDRKALLAAVRQLAA